MKRSILFGGLAAACLGAGALPAHAVPVFTYTSQDRSATAHATTTLAGANGDISDTKTLTAPDFGPFVADLTVQPMPPPNTFPHIFVDGQGTGIATQNSTLGPDAIDIHTSAFGNGTDIPEVSGGQSQSIAKVDFTVNSPASFTLTGNVTINNSSPSGFNEVIAEILGPGGTAVLPRIDLQRGNFPGSGGMDPVSQDISQTGILQPGPYTLDVESIAHTSEAVKSSADLTLTATSGPAAVPLPSASASGLAVLGGLGLLGLVRRRISRASA